MRLKENKIKILLSIISLTFIIFTAAVIQLSEYKIQTYYNDILFLILDMDNDLQRINFYNDNRIGNDINKLIIKHYNSTTPNKLDRSECSTLPGCESIMDSYERKDINLREYLFGMGDLYLNKINDLERTHNEKLQRIKKLMNDKPSFDGIEWTKIRHIAYVFHFLAIIFSIIIHIYLFMSLGKKYLTHIENQNKKIKEENLKLKEKLNSIRESNI